METVEINDECKNVIEILSLVFINKMIKMEILPTV